MAQIKKNNPSISALKGSAAQEVVNNVRTQLLGLCWGCGIMSAMCDYAYIYIYIHTYIYMQIQLYKIMHVYLFSDVM